MVDLARGGHLRLAREFLDLAWPLAGGKEAFWRTFLEQLQGGWLSEAESRVTR